MSPKKGCWIWELWHPISWRAHNTAVSINQHNFWMKSVTWRIKLQAFYLRHTRTRLDTGLEPGEILVKLGTMCVTQCSECSFLSATNACSSKLENRCAINSSIDHLQLVGQTCRPALQRIENCSHEDEVSHLSPAWPTNIIWPLSVLNPFRTGWQSVWRFLSHKPQKW